MERRLLRGTRKLFEVMGLFIILIVLMNYGACIYVETYQIVCFGHVQFIVCELYLNKNSTLIIKFSKTEKYKEGNENNLCFHYPEIKPAKILVYFLPIFFLHTHTHTHIEKQLYVQLYHKHFSMPLKILLNIKHRY